MGYVDEVKTCENLAKEFFEELEYLVSFDLMKPMKNYYFSEIRNLIKKYKPKMVS